MGVLTALALLQLPASPHVVFWPALAMSFFLDNCLSLWSQSPSCPLSPEKLDRSSLAPFPILAPLTPTDPEVYVHVAFSIFPQVGTAWHLSITKEKELNIPRLVQRL